MTARNRRCRMWSGRRLRSKIVQRGLFLRIYEAPGSATGKTGGYELSMKYLWNKREIRTRSRWGRSSTFSYMVDDIELDYLKVS